MWLKLSGTLYNMDRIVYVEKTLDGAVLVFSTTGNDFTCVAETVEQIEQMLMGDKEWSSSSPSKNTLTRNRQNSGIEVKRLVPLKWGSARAKSRGSSKAKRA
jgi:hypothetical protein